MGSVSTQSVTMKSFILASLFTTCLSAPTATHVASGDPAGPLTLAFGDAVHTPKGLRSYSLEGFSEDLDQDGFVDPIGQAVVVAPAVAPVTYTVPKVAVTVPKVAAVPAPAPVTYTVPKLTLPAPVTYTVPVPAVSDKDTVVPAATAPLIYSSVPVVPSVINYSGVKAEYASDPLVANSSICLDLLLSLGFLSLAVWFLLLLLLLLLLRLLLLLWKLLEKEWRLFEM